MLRTNDDDDACARGLIALEARALLTRLKLLKPFALQEPMLPAAALTPRAQLAIERHLAQGRSELRTRVEAFLGWLEGSEARRVAPSDIQGQFVGLRLRFNAALSQFDLFSDVVAQRSEHDTGVWLAGLDVAAEDMLRLSGDYFEAPPLACYLDRGPGGAIRRVRTRLPGGAPNPVAVIRMPRERMVGAGIASSLAHEVGHQGVTLLDMQSSLRPLLQRWQRESDDAPAWALWQRWMSEILADLWAIARVGVASTLGLMGVVSLPRALVFHGGDADPHPVPWFRVILSCALGDALYPDEQWSRLRRLWECFYPAPRELNHLTAAPASLLRTLPVLAERLLAHRPPRLEGATLAEALSAPDRQPLALKALHRGWRERPASLRNTPPSLAFAIIGQARADGAMAPEEESQLLGSLLTVWALDATLAGAEPRGAIPRLSLSNRTRGAMS